MFTLNPAPWGGHALLSWQMQSKVWASILINLSMLSQLREMTMGWCMQDFRKMLPLKHKQGRLRHIDPWQPWSAGTIAWAYKSRDDKKKQRRTSCTRMLGVNMSPDISVLKAGLWPVRKANCNTDLVKGIQECPKLQQATISMCTIRIFWCDLFAEEWIPFPT